MSTSVVSQHLTFDLPGEGWEDKSFHALVLADGTSCFVARDPVGDLEKVLRRRIAFMTDGARSVEIEARRAGQLGPLASEEARVVSREDDLWVYYRIASAAYYDRTLTFGVYGPDDHRATIDGHMDRIAAEVLLRRR